MPILGERQGIVVVGAQWGDEGKGGRSLNIVEQEKPDMVIRWGGGNNAGHTQEDANGNIIKTHLLPIGVLAPDTVSIIGNACYLDPVSLVHEIDGIRELGYDVSPSNLMISNAAHLIMAHHICIDEIREAGKGKQGSTKRGIAPTAGDKYLRTGLRAEKMTNDTHRDLLAKETRKRLHGINAKRKKAGLELIIEGEKLEEFMNASRILGEYVGNTTVYVNEEIKKEKTFVGEGHQGAMLDLDHGMYPFGTSANTTASSFYTSMGISTKVSTHVISVAKLTESRVGAGHLITEIKENEQPELLKRLVGEPGQPGAEYGTTSGRRRRMAHLNLPELRYSDLLNDDDSRSRSATKLDMVAAYGDVALMCVAVKYQGKYHEVLPGNSEDVLRECTPVYRVLPVWREDISNVKKFEDLPENAQRYIETLDEETGVRTDWIGVGPHRGQYITR